MKLTPLKRIKFLLNNHRKVPIDSFCVFFRGVIFFDDKLISSAKDYSDLAHKILFVNTDIKKFFSRISGVFSLVIYNESTTTATLISDLVRSYPIHIIKRNSETIITDNISIKVHNRVNKKVIEEFIPLRYVTGQNNFFQGVTSIQASEVLKLDSKGIISSERYFIFLPCLGEKDARVKLDLFVESFNSHLYFVIHKMLKSAPTVKNWVIPLSGGHDSRVIVNSLLKAKIKNVICFSYGTPDNPQSKISKQVAESAEYEWYFVEYTEEKWDKLFKRGLIDDYIEFAFQGVSIPHLQDFLAVYELKENGIVRDDDVFVPGHTLDFVSGGHLKNEDMSCESRDVALERAFRRFSIKKKQVNLVEGVLESIYDGFIGAPSQFQEYINWQERQAKFIVNSCRVYEFFGFEFRLPFWDRKFVDFWLGIAPSDRIERNLFLLAERKGILLEKLAAIPFEDELQEKRKEPRWKSTIKRILPNNLIVSVLRLTRSKKRLAEGMNMIFATRGKTVGDIIGPIEDFPVEAQNYVKPYLKRYPYQIDVVLMTKLYTLRKTINDLVTKDSG